jgi:hypothetical protein
MLPPVRLLLLREWLAEMESRNQRKSGRRVTRPPAAIPKEASTLDQMEIWAVASVGIGYCYYGLSFVRLTGKQLQAPVEMKTHIENRDPYSRARREGER